MSCHRWFGVFLWLVGCNSTTPVEAAGKRAPPAPSPREAAGASSLPAASVTSSDPSSIPIPAASGSSSASPSASVSSAASSSPPECPDEFNAPPGFSGCRAVEVTGAPPCEAFCTRPRKAQSKCCVDPSFAVVLSATGKPLLSLPACDMVPPECAHSHGHGNMDDRLRFFSDTDPHEVLIVEGGCESRAIMHGYVPPGVQAWTGCRHRVFRWNGSTFAEVKKP